MKLLQIKDKVAYVLTHFPETRDNDRLLQFKVWAMQCPELRKKEHRTWDFAELYIKGKLADPESIRRTRQKLQEKYEHFRGEIYKKRQAQKKSVKEQLKKM